MLQSHVKISKLYLTFAFWFKTLINNGILCFIFAKNKVYFRNCQIHVLRAPVLYQHRNQHFYDIYLLPIAVGMSVCAWRKPYKRQSSAMLWVPASNHASIVLFDFAHLIIPEGSNWESFSFFNQTEEQYNTVYAQINQCNKELQICCLNTFT